MLAADYIEVGTAPRTPPVEIVPPRPPGVTRAVWVDGAWEWTGDRFRWSPGAWVVPPEGARRAPWALVRRREDGRLFFAPATWRDETGRTLPDPVPLALARTRLGAPTPEEAAQERDRIASETEAHRRGERDRARRRDATQPDAGGEPLDPGADPGGD